MGSHAWPLHESAGLGKLTKSQCQDEQAKWLPQDLHGERISIRQLEKRSKLIDRPLMQHLSISVALVQHLLAGFGLCIAVYVCESQSNQDSCREPPWPNLPKIANIHARASSLTCMAGRIWGHRMETQRLSLQTSLTREPKARPG